MPTEKSIRVFGQVAVCGFCVPLRNGSREAAWSEEEKQAWAAWFCAYARSFSIRPGLPGKIGWENSPSGRAGVAVVQAADLRNGDDFAALGRLDLADFARCGSRRDVCVSGGNS